MDAKQQAIWIDLDNSPHVPLFAPIIKHYRDSGIEVIVTARDHAQTIELLDLHGLKGTYFVIGRHYGKNKLNKIRGLISRTLDFTFLLKTDVAVAVSHGSRSMILAALGMNIPILTMYDYEYTETRLFNKLSDRILVPDRIPDIILDQIRVKKDKRVKYPGIKEELYVRGFKPAPGFRRQFLEQNGIPSHDDQILVVLRPPATTANYHEAKSDVLLVHLIKSLLDEHNVTTVVLPRTGDQALEIAGKFSNIVEGEKRFVILNKAVNGLDLAFASDLLISGGGTMNREAALLGVPVYSIFAGKQGALDRQMESEGLITFIRSQNDVDKIKLSPRHRDPQFINPLTDRVERFVIEQINSFLT